MKSFKSTLVLLVLGIALGAYIFFFERGPKKDDTEKKDKVFTSFVADDVQEIRVEYPGNTLTGKNIPLTIKKDDKGAWQITQPVKLKADETIVRQTLTSVGQMAPDDSLATPGNLADYGLVNPSAKFTFISKGKAPDVLLVGDKTVASTDYYCLNPALKTVFLIPPYIPEGLMKSPNDMREHSIVKTDLVAAQKVAMTFQSKTLVLIKDDKNVWNIEKPIKEKADPGKVRDLLNQINSSRVDEFVEDNPRSLAPYGLSTPRASITIWPADHTPPTTLLLGRQKLKATTFFAKVEGQNSVFLLPTFIDTTLHFKLNDFRDKSVMGFDLAQVKSLTVRHNQQVYTYQKDAKGQWTSTSRMQASTEASAIINGLAQTTIADFAAPNTQTGVQTPSYTAEVALSDGTIRRYRFGRREKEQVYLASDKTKDIYLVSPSTLSQMESFYNVILTPLPAVAVTPVSAKP